MAHIRNRFDMVKRILTEESDGDLMYYLENITTWDEALEVIKTLRKRITDMSLVEMDKEMKKHLYTNKDDLINQFWFIIEKQRNYPLWMGELSDVYEWAEDWAKHNWYAHLFED